MSSNLIVNNIEVGAGATIYTAASNTLTFGTNGSEKVRITSDGKVGIGTNNPGRALEVYDATHGQLRIRGGSGGSDSNRKADLNFFASGARSYVIRADAADAALKIIDESGGDVNRFHIASNGKVGIGTDVPDYGLHVYGAGDILIEDSGNGSAHLRLRSANGGSDVSNWKLKTSSNNYFYIENDTVGGLSQFTIDSSGDVDVRGNIKSNNLPGNNLIHNGEFAIWQRGTTAIYSSQNKYLVDRFKFISNTDGNGSVHQHTNVPTVAQTGGSKFAYSLRLNCTTADTSLSTLQYINLSTRIEGRDLRHLGFGQAGTRYATLSFWQRSPSGTYHVSFRNSAYNRYYIASYTAANNTWEKHELTIPIDTGGTWATDHSMGLDITWSLGGGSGYISGTVGSWQNSSSHAGSGQKNFFDTVGNDFYITGVQFEKGTIATPFEHKSYGEDLHQCQRYFFTITPPVGFINATEDLGIAFTSSANEVQFPIKFPVEMRATPSVEQVTGSNYFRIGQGNLGGDKYISGSWIVNNMSPNGGNLYTDPDSNLSSYIGQAATIQLKNTSARLALRSEF